MKDHVSLLIDLDRKRRAMGISYTALARQSGVSLPTTRRILGGKETRPSFTHVLAIASILGYALTEIESGQNLQEQQARRQARRLVRMVQATAGLEGQGVSTDILAEMEAQTVHQLMSGSRRKLWGG